MLSALILHLLHSTCVGITVVTNAGLPSKFSQRSRLLGAHFRKFSMTNGTPFSRISRKDDNLARFTKIFDDLLQELLFHLNLLPELSVK